MKGVTRKCHMIIDPQKADYRYVAGPKRIAELVFHKSHITPFLQRVKSVLTPVQGHL